MVVMLLLWIQALPEPPKPVPPPPAPQVTGFTGLIKSFSGGGISPSDVVWDGASTTLRIGRFQGRDIFFASRSFDLEEADREAIAATARNLSDKLAKYPQVVVVVNGTADPNVFSDVRPPRNNVELSALRAAQVSQALVDAGLTQRIQIVGLGVTGEKGKSKDEMKEFRRVFLELHWVETAAKPSAQD